jgi:hypothetical protein
VTSTGPVTPISPFLFSTPHIKSCRRTEVHQTLHRRNIHSLSLLPYRILERYFLVCQYF